MAKLININNDLEVKKADVVVKARYKLNTLSLKFVTSLIANIKRGDDINEEYIFKVKDFKDLTKLKRKDLYWAIKEAVKELLEKPLYIPYNDGFIICNWISGGHYVENLGEVRFMIYPKLRPYLLEAQEKFLKYKLENILSLRSSYSIRLYEILKDWLELNTRYGKVAEKIIELNEFREILEIPKSYQYYDIKRQIFKKAKVELEKYTDVIFKFEEIKTGRKVTHLKFIIMSNPTKNNTNSIINQCFTNRKYFVELLRKKYKGSGKWGFKFISGKNYWLGLDNNGLVYGTNEDNLIEFNSKDSATFYDLWLKIAQNSKIYQDIVIKGISLKELDEKSWNTLNKDIIKLKEKGII